MSKNISIQLRCHAVPIRTLKRLAFGSDFVPMSEKLWRERYRIDIYFGSATLSVHHLRPCNAYKV